jgi:hypothetical protein
MNSPKEIYGVLLNRHWLLLDKTSPKKPMDTVQGPGDEARANEENFPMTLFGLKLEKEGLL